MKFQRKNKTFSKEKTLKILKIIGISLAVIFVLGAVSSLFMSGDNSGGGSSPSRPSTPDTSRPAVTEPATDETEKATEPETEPAREITFKLMGDSCTALEGMTWGEWVDTDYNFGGYYDTNLVVVSSDGEHIESNAIYGGLFIVLDGNYISPNDLIIENGLYDCEEP